MRIAQVGVGMRGKKWAHIVQENLAVETVAYVDVELGALRAWAIKAGEPRALCYSELAQALDETRPDALLIVTPPEGHYEQIMAAFERSLPVLVEKPMVENLDQAIELVQEAETRCLALMVGMNFRYAPSHQAIRNLVRERRLGIPSFAQYTYLRHREGRRPDLNKYALSVQNIMLMEQSIHHLDLMRYCYGREVQTVMAQSWNPPWSMYAGDCNTNVLLTFPGDLYVNYMATYATGWNNFDFRWRTDCSNGVIIQRAQFGDLYTAAFSEELAWSEPLYKTEREAEQLQSVELPNHEDFVDDTRHLLVEFVEAVENGKPLETSGRDHLKTLALVLACIEAARTGQSVNMSDFYQSLNIPERWL